ncbi:hypothetical protein FACS1894214_0050 [Planctomycetales bacterium]|nr:hypothetical protein FACS1894214_0050 [Planctomycetales bacterium]
MKNVFLLPADLESLQTKKPSSYLEPEYEPYYREWKERPSDRSREKLLDAISPVIEKNIKLIGGADPNYLSIKGKVLAMKAMDRYDPDKSAMSTFLSYQLMPLRQKARQQMNMTGIPDRVLQDVHRLEGAENELEDVLGRAPTTDELADKLGVSIKHIEKIRKSGHARNSGSFETPDEEGGTSSPEVRRTMDSKYLHEYVLSALDSDPVSKYIYETDNGLFGRQPASVTALAERFKLSPGAISQRRAKIYEIVNNADTMIYG